MAMSRRGSMALLAALLLAWLPVAPAGALGGVGSDQDGRVLRLDPSTGAVAQVSAGGVLGDPMGIAVEASGDFVVADATFNGGPGAVTRIDEVTGTQSVVSSGGNLVDPFGIAVEATGGIVVTDIGTAQVIRVDPATGAQTIVFPGDAAFFPTGIAVEASGDLVTVGLFNDEGAVVRIDPSTGVRTVVSNLGMEAFPFGVAVEPGGDIVVTVLDPFTGFFGTGGSQVLRIDPSSGVRTILSSGGALLDPFGIDVEASGDLVVAVSDFFLFGDFGRTPGLVRVNGSTGAQSQILSGAPLVAPHDVAIEPGGSVAIADASVLSTCGGAFATQTGTSGNDVIAGTAGFDVILAGGGNDRVSGSADFDVICGGPGNDVLRGGEAGDGLFGDEGNDVLLGQSGGNFMIGWAGRDRIIGGGGSDFALGGNGRDVIRGKGKRDFLVGDRGADELDGGPGEDQCRGGPGNDDILECERGKQVALMALRSWTSGRHSPDSPLVRYLGMFGSRTVWPPHSWQR